ncbi:hypothetical protein NX059_003265 [Plenodomus lindquistii]|nr:hypothetical protein NX059_003265 [Plenodomus lindquistii]
MAQKRTPSQSATKPSPESSTAAPVISRDKPTPTRSKMRYRGFIQICVGKGDQEETFDVHENLLTTRSLFFRKALSGVWQESVTRRVNLTDDEKEIFHIYVNLLYTGQLAMEPELERVSADTRDLNEGTIIAKLYVLAEKLQDVETKDLSVAKMLALCQSRNNNGRLRGPYSEWFPIVYQGTTSGSPMRKLLVDICTFGGGKQWQETLSEVAAQSWSRDFILELAIRLMSKRMPAAELLSAATASTYLEKVAEAQPE